MEIYLDKRALRQIRTSVSDAIDEGDTETLREDIIEAFSDEDVEEIERRIDSGDFFEFISDILDEWSLEDSDELFELFEAQLSDIGIDLKYGAPNVDDDVDDEADEEADPGLTTIEPADEEEEDDAL
ncbi:MAG: hypothetical protein ACOCV4_00745 [Myxococcota bacterium]